MNVYRVQWHDPDGKPVTLRMGALTAGVKQAFVNWLKPQMLAEAIQWMPAADYLDFRDRLATKKASAYWSNTMAGSVSDAIGSKEGSLYLNRLLFGDGVKDWSDDELWAMLTAKDADPASDYRVAFDLVWAEAHPKAKPPAGGDPTSSTSNGTPTSTPTSTSAAPTGTTGPSPSLPAGECSGSPTSAPPTLTA